MRARALVAGSAKGMAEIGHIAVAETLGDLGDRLLGVAQQDAGALETNALAQLAQALSFPGQVANESRLADIKQFRQLGAARLATFGLAQNHHHPFAPARAAGDFPLASLQFALRESTVLLEHLLPAHILAFHSTPTKTAYSITIRPDGPTPATLEPPLT